MNSKLNCDECASEKNFCKSYFDRYKPCDYFVFDCCSKLKREVLKEIFLNFLDEQGLKENYLTQIRNDNFDRFKKWEGHSWFCQTEYINSAYDEKWGRINKNFNFGLDEIKDREEIILKYFPKYLHSLEIYKIQPKHYNKKKNNLETNFNYDDIEVDKSSYYDPECSWNKDVYDYMTVLWEKETSNGIIVKKNVEEMGGLSVYEKYTYDANGDLCLEKISECYDNL